jgi:predicted GNAT family N-acyltransferase
MSNYQFREIEFNSPAYQEEVDLRYRILREPLGLTFNPADLAKEGTDFHLGLYVEEKLRACLIFTPLASGELKMRQVAVDDGEQGKGLGTVLVQKSEKWALAKGYNKLVLHARETAVPFYLRMEYKKESQPFMEVGIPHFKMFKSLTISS